MIKTKGKDPVLVAALLSGLVTPGSGQFYLGDKIKGAIFLFLELALLGVIAYIAIKGVSGYSQVLANAADLGATRMPGGLSERIFDLLKQIGLVFILLLINRIASIWDAVRSAQKKYERI